MSVISCQEETRRPAREREDGTREHVRTYFVTTDDANDNGTTILASGELPARFSLHPDDGAAYCVSREVEPIDGSHWHHRATINYSTKLGERVISPGLSSGGSADGGQLGDMTDENPLNRAPDIFWDTETIQEAQQFDMDGRRWATSAREPFDPPKVVTRELLALNFTRNLASFNPILIATYTGAVNQSPFLGFEIDEILLRKLTARFKEEKKYAFFEVFARLVFNPMLPAESGTTAVIALENVFMEEKPLYRGTWKQLVLDAGYMEIVAGQQRQIVMPNGQPPTRPVHLNGSGIRLSTVTQEITEVYLERRPCHRRDLANLNLF